MNKCISLYAGLILTCSSCGTMNSNDRQVNAMIGKTIEMPDQLRCVQIGRDWPSVDLDKEYKIVTYVDAGSCNECALKILGEWRRLLDDLTPDQNARVGFVCVMSAANMAASDSAMARLQIPVPVYYDIPGNFIQKNELYVDAKYRTFMLDRANRIILIGEPVGRPELWNLYKKVIAGHLRKD